MSMGNLYCPYCGAQQLNVTARYCYRCGRPFPRGGPEASNGRRLAPTTAIWAAALVVVAAVIVVFSIQRDGGGRKIAFCALASMDEQSPDLGIHVINPDGSGEARLTSAYVNAFSPAWSPDGKRISYLVGPRSWSSQALSLEAMNTDGSKVTRLTDIGGAFRMDINSWASSPWQAWSPDGLKIAFSSVEEGGEDIYVVNANGTNLKRLTDMGGSCVLPAWSPDGGRIAFFYGSLSYSSRAYLYVMNSDGSGQVQLAVCDQQEPAFSWSPDGRRIAFNAIDGGEHSIFVINADGSGLTRLANKGKATLHPAWSPDGKKIAFVWGDSEIRVINADGSNQTRLASFRGRHPMLAWSRDGRKITFQALRGNGEYDYGVYTVNADGTDLALLTNGRAMNVTPVWQP